jgi:hypothetical protein
MNWIKKALTRRISVKVARNRKPKIVLIKPSQRLVYGIIFAIIALIALTVLAALHMIVVKTFSSEIFAAITLVIGTILGAFFGQKG